MGMGSTYTIPPIGVIDNNIPDLVIYNLNINRAKIAVFR
jgi:hypothetical protein